jgi:hypothetical protein
MTPERAQQIIQAAYDTCTCGPWSDQLDKVMSREERAEVNEVWETMPGDTCFVDAIYRIAHTNDPMWSIKTSRTD